MRNDLIQAMYDTAIGKVTRSVENWKHVLQMAGTLYRFEFDNILLIYEQKPAATLVADYDTWKKVDRYVKRGSKGIAIFPSRALKPHMRHVFDIADTGGRERNLTWSLHGETQKDYLKYLVSHGQIVPDADTTQELSENSMKLFTGTNVWSIMQADFEERISEFTQIAGSVITEYVPNDAQPKREGLPGDMNAAERLLYSSIMYEVGTRCGFDVSAEEQDFRQIVNITDEEMIYRLGSLVCDVSCNVLREIGKTIKAMESERRMAHGKLTTGVQRGGWSALSADRTAAESGRGTGAPGQIRPHGDDVSKGERTDQIQEPLPVRPAGTKDERRGDGGQRADGSADGELSHTKPTEGSLLHHGDVENPRTGADAGGGSGAASDRDEVSLNEELNKELDELNSFGKQREAGEYRQASFFDAEFGLSNDGTNLFPAHTTKISKDTFSYKGQEITYLEPKKEAHVPEEYVRQVVLRGTGFENGRRRVCEIFETETEPATRAKRIKQEYGQGGAGWPIDGYGLHGYDTFHSKGIRFTWRLEDGEHEGYVSWAGIEREISALILTGEYLPERVRIDEILMDGLREDEEIIDAEYREVESADEELDEFAIPGEPGSYAESPDARKADNSTDDWGMTEDELAEEDRMVTIAEYGAEIATESGFETPEYESSDMPVSKEPAESDSQQKKHNYHFNLWEVETGGPKTRFQWNVDAITLLKQLESEGRLATPQEQKILAKYVGWGGLSQAFDAHNAGWEKEYGILKALLTEEEYAAARATVNNAFYTPPEVAASIGLSLMQFGFRGGNVLEPSMGTGNFFGTLPSPLLGSSLYGVELDSLSGRIAGQLYQNADISITGFEQTSYPDNFFDVAIGNVPFGDYKLYDPKYNKYNFRIHDYFIAKTLDQIRPGGMAVLITTKGTLDKANPTIRKYIAERAELVGAIRLPNSTFKGNAGAEVTADILFLQKRERKISIEPDWVHLGYTDNGIAVNSYFAEHPEMMLGVMAYDTGQFGADSKYTVCVNDNPDFNLYEAINRAVKNIHAQLTDFDRLCEEEEDRGYTIPADPDVRNFTYTVRDGEIYYRENSQMIRQRLSQNAKERIIGMDEIRTITRELITLQMEGCSEEELLAKQKELNDRYDAFVKKYGSINGKSNKSAFRDDGDYPLLCSLEEINEDGEVKKADMFYRQTIKAKVEIERVETAVEALNVSVNEFGTVNLAYMLSIYEPDISGVKAALSAGTGQAVAETGLTTEAETDLKRQALIDELTGLIFLNPDGYNENNPNVGWETADEYLSGNVRDKLRRAEAFAKEKPQYGINVEALKEVQPPDIDAADIDVRIGTTWIEPKDYERFIYELLNTPRRVQAVRSRWYNSGIQIHLNKISMDWFIENKSLDKRSVAATKTYGTSRVDAYSIFEDTLNLKTVTVRDRIDDGGGKYHYEVNKNETMLAREKQNQMKAQFKDWLFSDPERRQKYVTYYNETFNNVRLREYNGTHLTFPGMNPEIELKPHQKNAVARILMGGNTLLAHCVGAGKSFEMMAACMEQKRLGLAQKNVMVVPKPLIGQTASEFLRLYPSANILVATERDFEKSRRKQFISRIATGDYDCIIMSHSQFEKIPISAERRIRMLDAQVDEISYAIEEMKENNGERWTVKQMESKRKKLKEQIQSLADESRKDNLITFEELGIDSIMVDEAHAFKNAAIFSKMNNVAGISSNGAKKSMDMQMKCQYLTEINNGRGIVFATGTPISNTMCEMYVMQRYLQKEALEQMGLHHFDSWAANFGEVTTALELTVEGSGFRFKSRFNKFTNLPELMNIFREVADVQTSDMLNLDVPDLRGGKPIIVESEPDGYVQSVMEDFVVRAERIRSGGIDPSEDNFLKITHEARLLGTDARLLDRQAPGNPDGKLDKVADNVYREYVLGNADGQIGCQLIFSDIGVPKQNWSEEMIRYREEPDPVNWEWNSEFSFDIYNYLKMQLIKKGIPAEEIAFVHDAKTDAQRDVLFKEMRTGKKKILIGSTDKCGTGVNVQTHLTALHHIDCPWKPSSIEQREGRGIRQGNENEEISVYRYVTKSTFDAYNWSVVENKQRFISQVMTSKAVSRSCEDIDEATLSYAEIKAVATGNPLIKEKMEVDNEVQRLKLLKSAYDNQRYGLQDNFMVKFPKLIKAATEKLSCVEEDIRHRDRELAKTEDFAITVQGALFTERAEGGNSLLAAIAKCKTGETTAVGAFRGFTVLVEKNFMGLDYLILRGKTEYKVEMSTSPVGNMVKLENCFNSLHEHKDFVEKKLEQYRNDLTASKAEYEKPFAHEEEYREKIARQAELNAQLDLENEKVADADLGGRAIDERQEKARCDFDERSGICSDEGAPDREIANGCTPSSYSEEGRGR